jgi:hypothetical protein
MKNISVPAIFATLVFMAVLLNPVFAHTLFLRRGSEIAATITATLDSGKSRAGERVAAAIRGGGVPDGSSIQGRVESVSRFSSGHDAAINIVFNELQVPGEAAVRFSAHVVFVASPRASAFSRTKNGFKLVSRTKRDLLLKKGMLVRLQTLDDVVVGQEASAPVRAPVSETRVRENHAPPTQGAHPYDAGGEMPY